MFCSAIEPMTLGNMRDNCVRSLGLERGCVGRVGAPAGAS